jgi:hypothetical protein
MVLAVGVSGSVDDSRFKLQREATGAALLSDECEIASKVTPPKSEASHSLLVVNPLAGWGHGWTRFGVPAGEGSRPLTASVA